MKLLKPIDINKILLGKEETVVENKTLTDIYVLGFKTTR